MESPIVHSSSKLFLGFAFRAGLEFYCYVFTVTIDDMLVFSLDKHYHPLATQALPPNFPQAPSRSLWSWQDPLVKLLRLHC